jgi:hypothetical protein
MIHIAICHQDYLHKHYSKQLDFEELLNKIDEQMLGELTQKQSANWNERHRAHTTD